MVFSRDSRSQSASVILLKFVVEESLVRNDGMGGFLGLRLGDEDGVARAFDGVEIGAVDGDLDLLGMSIGTGC